MDVSLRSKSEPLQGKKNAVVSSRAKPRAAKEEPSRNSSTAAPCTPKRYASPNSNRTRPAASSVSLPKRAQSAERRPSTPTTPSSSSSRSTTPARDTLAEARNPSRRSVNYNRAPQDGLWPSMRSLSSSFLAESVPVSASVPLKKKEKISTNTNTTSSSSDQLERKRTPLRQSENNARVTENGGTQNKMIDQRRWPAMIGGKVSSVNMSRSVDLTDKVNKTGSVISSLVSRAPRGVSPKRAPPPAVVSSNPDKINKLTNSLSKSVDLTDNSSKMKRPVSSRGVSPRRSNASDLASISVSRSADLGVRRPTSSRGSSPRRSMVSDANGRVEEKAGTSGTGTGLNLPSQRSDGFLSLTRASRTLSSPISGFNNTRPSSPSIRRTVQSSPSRARPTTPNSLSSGAHGRSSVLSPSIVGSSSNSSSTSKGKKSLIGNQMEEIHQLRLLHNRVLQWCFVNSLVDDTFYNQKLSSESMLYAMWDDISMLRDSVITKRFDVQCMRQETKMGILLNGQIEYLEQWESLERGHCSSLSGAIEAIKATTLRLPVTAGAKADVFAVRNSVSSAVDVMQAMGSSICLLLSKVESTSSLVEELSIIASKEKTMLAECRELLATAAKLQVQESSLKTHLIQLKQDSSNME